MNKRQRKKADKKRRESPECRVSIRAVCDWVFRFDPYHNEREQIRTVGVAYLDSLSERGARA